VSNGAPQPLTSLIGQGNLKLEVAYCVGGVISPLLANVYLHALDRVWQERYAKLGQLTRYADDLVICCWKQEQAGRALEVLTRLLAELGLQLAPAKTRVVNLEVKGEGFDFLGYHFRRIPSRKTGRPYAACWPSRAAMTAARDRVRTLTSPDRIGRPAIMVVEELNRFLRGWGAYFRHGNSTRQFHHLDQFVFERLARFIARKHGSRNWRRGMIDLIESRTTLGLYRLAGTVRYASAHAMR